MAAGAGRASVERRYHAYWALLTLLAAGACASGPRRTVEAGTAERATANVLSGEVLRATNAANLWDALTQLRPQWLRARASASLISGRGNEPQVYVHEVPYGPPRVLQQMNIDQIRRVEFIDGRDATTRFGTGHGGGVIMVELNRN